MWQLYDNLIDAIPDGIIVNQVHIGPVWTIVSCDGCCGIAVTINEQSRKTPPVESFQGKELRELAGLCKSWDYLQASVGTAALNAYHNNPSRVFSSMAAFDCNETGNTFDDYTEEVRGKKVAVVGHFIALERVLKTAEKVTVLERNPVPGDLPDPACEFVLPEQDFVFITGSAFTNKTLGRLVQLSAGAKTIVIGPSTPINPSLFSMGVDEISGLIVENIPVELFHTIGSHHIKLSRIGKRTRFTK